MFQPPSFGTWPDVTRIARHIALPIMDFYASLHGFEQLLLVGVILRM